MNPILNKNLFLVKEKIGMFKASNNYDIFDPENNHQIMTTKEVGLGFFTKMFRFTDYKRNTPFNVVVTTPEGKPIVSIKRGIAIFVPMWKFLMKTTELLDFSNKNSGHLVENLKFLTRTTNIYAH